VTGLRVADVAAVLDRWYPPGLAESGDVVGLSVGSRDAAVNRILLAVEPIAAVVTEAARDGADLLVTHHPLLLHGISRVDTGAPKGAVIESLLGHRIALYVAHTNADVAAGGVADGLAATLGLRERTPLRPRPSDRMDKVVTFVPVGQAAAVIDALAAAGAGRIGYYERCAYTAPGTGTFRPLPGARPYLGVEGRVEEVEETRIEMVLPRGRRGEVVAALRASHPYEEPAFDLIELATSPSPEVGLGRVGLLAAPLRLAEFAEQVAGALPATPGGIRVAGDPDRPVQRVAVQAGAGGDLLEAARAAGVDAYVTSDLRHHPASEALAWPQAPALIDVPHWAAEWTWLPVLERRLADELASLGHSIPVGVSQLVTDPWTSHLPSGGRTR
jgi:dinuclear metal center YbgI/SA1388 family protein